MIRKRFIKDIKDISGGTLVPENGKPCDIHLKRDNLILKQKCKSVEVEVGFQKIEKVKLELFNDRLRDKKYSLDEELNNAKNKIHVQAEEIEKQTEELIDNKCIREFIQKQLGKLKSKFDQIQLKLKDSKVEGKYWKKQGNINSKCEK